MKRLLLLALPALLAGCPKPREAVEATPPPAAAVAAEPAEPEKPAAAKVAEKVEFLNAGVIRTAGTLPKYHWRLVSASDAKGQRIEALLVRPAQPVTLDFRAGQLAVSHACNHMSGTYVVGAKGVSVDKLASTKRACTDPKLSALDQEIGTRLQGTLAARMSKGDARQLELKTASGDALVFAGEETAAARYGNAGERVFLEVAAQTKPCSRPQMPAKACLQVRELKYDDKGLKVGTPGAFANFFADIEGYTHEPGVRNVLRVDRYSIKNPPAGGSSLAYVLDMVVESENTAGK